MQRLTATFLCLLALAGPALAQETPGEPAPESATPAPLASAPRPTETRIADRVILVRDERMRQTHFTLVIHAGCLEEEGGCRGIAHYLEHLLLVGRNSDHAETAFRFFADGYANGWTNQRATAYVHRIAPRSAEAGGALPDLERLFAFYANRLSGFEISEADAERERRVVLQEYELRTGNTPFGRFGVRFDETLLRGHPVGQRVIGSPETIATFSLADARRFHARWYASNNATVVVAGNLDPEAVRAVVARTLGAVPPRTLPAREGRVLPAVANERVAFVETAPGVRRRSVSLAKLIAMPDETAARRGARVLLASFLSSQLAGSPHDLLVERQGLTDGVSAGLARYLPGLYSLRLSGEPNPEAEPEALAAAFRTYLAELAAEGGPDEALLQRLKRRVQQDFVTGALTGERLMGRIVDWVAMGEPYEALARYPREIAAVTRADVADLLGRLAGPGRELTGTLLPQEPR